MKSEQKQFFLYPDTQTNEFPNLDRRRFLQYVAGVSAMVGLGGSAFGQAQEAATDLRLPDGTEHASWERPLTFSKTYYVDNNSTKADDNGPGSSARPFRTINKAAECPHLSQASAIVELPLAPTASASARSAAARVPTR